MMPHWSDRLKEASLVCSVQFSRIFITVFSPIGALLVFKECQHLVFLLLIQGRFTVKWTAVESDV